VCGKGKRVTGIVFNVQRYSIHDGPGIRTTVFFKGCPMGCEWCHNPESRAETPELSLLPSRCVACGACVEACPHAAVVQRNGTIETDRSHCTACGACAEVCPSGARSLLGSRMSAEQLLAEVDRDRVFYEESDGGVTFSGGEPLAQAEFLLECLGACKQRGLHTAVDTAGYAPAETLWRVARLTDLFLYDLKLMDDARHREHLGVSNTLILDNLRGLCERGFPTWLRLPLIPGINDDEPNLAATADFVGALKGPPPVHLLPYHRIGSTKYEQLGLRYSLPGIDPPTDAMLAAVVRRLRARGLDVKIGG